MPDREEKYVLILLQFKIKDVKVAKFISTNSVEANFLWWQPLAFSDQLLNAEKSAMRVVADE